MSRISKYLRQTCIVEAYRVSGENPVRNDFGELVYERPVSRKCRHEITHRDVQTPDGSIRQVSSVYYLDSSFSVEPEYLIDGRPVQSVVSYVGSSGIVEGYEVYV